MEKAIVNRDSSMIKAVVNRDSNVSVEEEIQQLKARIYQLEDILNSVSEELTWKDISAAEQLA